MSAPQERDLPGVFRDLTHQHLQARRDAGLPVSSSHAEGHLNATADLASILGGAYNFTERETLLARYAAQFHDIVRSSSEGSGGVEERASARTALLQLHDLKFQGLIPTSYEERDAIAHAIINQSNAPDFFKDPQRREEVPQNLRDRLHAVLYIADGLQKLGAPLVARRSAYVGGERRGIKPNGEAGDLNGVMYEGRQISAIQAVLLESAVRLGWRNIEEVYPRRFAEVIEPAFEIQREWVAGLLAFLEMDMRAWVDMVWNSRNPKGENIFDLARKNVKIPPATVDEVLSVLIERGRMTDERIEMAQRDPDLMSSAVDAVEYFSVNWQNPDQASVIRDWNPQGRYARMWKEGMQ